MKASAIGLGCLVIVAVGLLSILGLGSYVWGAHTTMVTEYQKVEGAWSNVENMYQRRFDLIPNMVEMIKGAAKHEHDTFKEVAEARAAVGKATIDLKNATPEQFAAFQQAQSGLAGALSKLMMVSEQYPQLKANDNFLAGQASLEGTENRIAVARKDFNTVVQDYNTKLGVFPNNFLAGFFGFSQRPYFKMDEAAKSAPAVKF